MQANMMSLYTPSTSGWDQKFKLFLSEEGHVAHQIKRKEV